MKYVIHRVTVT